MKYRAKPKAMGKFFKSKIFNILQKLVINSQINLKLDELKKMQFNDLDSEYMMGEKDWKEFPSKDPSGINFWCLIADAASTDLIAFGIKEDTKGDLPYLLVKERVRSNVSKNREFAKNNVEFCQKYFWEMPEFYANGNEGYIEALNKIRDFVYAPNSNREEKIYLLEMIDDMKVSLKNDAKKNEMASIMRIAKIERKDS